MRAAGDAGVPEPTVYYIFQRDDNLGDGFVMSWVGGEALGAKIVRSPEFASIRPRLAFECGRILALIHEIDLDRYGLRDQLAEMSPAVFLDQMLERYDLLDSPQPMIDYAAEWLRDHLPNPSELTLVHNDFRNGNFLLEPTGISAVLDWEVAHIGDPMRDLGWMLTHSWRFGRDHLPVGGFGETAEFFAGYESVSGVPVDAQAVRFWQVFGSFWWAVGCLGMAEHYRNGPDKTVERPAIGRRSSECQVDCVNLLIPGPVQLETPQAQPEAMPGVDELLTSVSDFLREDVMSQTQGRAQFMARVAANSLDIVQREVALAEVCRASEKSRLCGLFGVADTGVELNDLRWRLVKTLREGSLPLDSEPLQAHLRATVVNQIAIDQPRYPGFSTATKGKDRSL